MTNKDTEIDTKHYLACYSSKGNIVNESMYIEAKNLVEAQNKFFDFLKSSSLYQHMWNLNLEIKPIKGSL